jgi:SNF2 family DNA or RNA helicase
VNPGDRIKHDKFGFGRVEFDKGLTIIARFQHGIEECERTSLDTVSGPVEAIASGEWHSPLKVIARAQAAAIESINDSWGVFSLSRIALLPHQLWVCRRVVEKWPARWLVADDVGLGKTIEAGLILWPLLAKGTIKRLLIVCPAALVEQWQYRLRTMFDIRLAQYVTEADTSKTDFWGTHNQVVASLETLRLDKEGKQKDRQNRIFESPPWDLLVVDEAHHLNADEDSGPTLGYKFVRRLVELSLVDSIVFFTGTPHRGKDFGFLSILSLLRPDLFNTNEPLLRQLPSLKEVMIRNNKQSVTDLRGNKLFQPPIVNSETFSYSESEKRFYEMLTQFIVTGKAYASSLGATEGKAVMLVLIAIQKLASSSVAAVRRSLSGRLQRIVKVRTALESLKTRANDKSGIILAQYVNLEQTNNSDEINKLEEKMAELSATLKLMENEEQRLQELVAAADQVERETKIDKIVSVMRNSFPDRRILFFTEYKATQSLLMSALIKEFGDGCVTFINGDGKAEDVVGASGHVRPLFTDRSTAADNFNSGAVRFLVSTEAGGEGIDLQEQCHTLIHVDLPWNPMRLHQRVGRLNRYGQSRQVEVMTFRNPDTVESLIWEKLNQKIGSIMLAFGQVMDEPEDLLQLVLGMTSPSLFREIFAEGSAVPSESLSHWFNQKTTSFGGKDVVETVKSLVGNCAKFDFQQVSSQLPGLDLPALRPFLVSMLVLNNRKIREDDQGLSFKTPESWLSEPGIRTSYEGMIFDRQDKSKNALQRILGVGHKVVNEALKQARKQTESAALLPSTLLDTPVFIYQVFDRVTGSTGPVKVAIVGVSSDMSGLQEDSLFKDWELLELLNGISMKPVIRKQITDASGISIEAVHSCTRRATETMEKRIATLGLPFTVPTYELTAILWPSSAEAQASEEKEEEH